MVQRWRIDIVAFVYQPAGVDCYSGYKANERPRAFVLDGQRHEVVEIVDRWYEGGRTAADPQVDIFKVKTAGGAVFMLRYNALFDAWTVARV
jgi:hypothetical protein